MTIPNVTKKQVIDALTNTMLAQSYSVRSITDYHAVYGMQSNSALAAMLFGSQYDSVPEVRVSFAIVDTASGVRVVATLQMVTNPGSAFERVMDASQSKASQSWQNMLEQLKDTFYQGHEESVGRDGQRVIGDSEKAPPVSRLVGKDKPIRW